MKKDAKRKCSRMWHRRIRRFLPALHRIGYVRPQQNYQPPNFGSTTSTTSSSTSYGYPFALSEKEASVTKLTLPELYGWATSARTFLTFAVAGIIATLYRDDVIRVNLAFLDASTWHRATRITILPQSNGGYQLIFSKTCGRYFFLSVADGQYFSWMNKFIYGVGSSIPIDLTSTWAIYFRSFENNTLGQLQRPCSR